MHCIIWREGRSNLQVNIDDPPRIQNNVFLRFFLFFFYHISVYAYNLKYLFPLISKFSIHIPIFKILFEQRLNPYHRYKNDLYLNIERV